MSKTERRRIRVRALIEAALPHLDALPPMTRADVYEGIAEVTAQIAPELQRTAAQIAEQLRNADLMQLHFRNLFADTHTD